MDRAGVAGPRFHHGLHGGRWPGLVEARPSGRSGPRWLAVRVATGRARRPGGPARPAWLLGAKKAGWAGWPLRRLGRKLKEIPFQIKN
jgi:hypothetical protein